MAYAGPDRRHNDDELHATLAEIRTDVRWIKESLPTLATSERVDALEKSFDSHVENHGSKNGLIAAWAGTAVALAIGVFSLLGGV